MTVPLSDTRLTEIRERVRRMSADQVDAYNLLAEVDRLRAELAELRKTPRERANDRVRALREAGDIEGACAAAEAFEASEAYDAAHPRY